MAHGPRRIDLHVHTHFSDGTDSPLEVLDLAAELGLSAVAFTDHDTLEGVRAMRGVGHPVRVVPGVELSAIEVDGTEVHVLGYFVSVDSQSFQSTLDRLVLARADRGALIVDRVNVMLQREGLAPMDYAAVQAEVTDVVGRPHVGRHMVNQGYVRTIQEAFVRYLVPCNVPKAPLSPEESVELICRSGGLAALAHPGKLRLPLAEVAELVDRMIEAGMAGIEVYYAGHSAEETESMRRIADSRGLALTGGSDYHGHNKEVQLGTPPLSEALLDRLEVLHAR